MISGILWLSATTFVVVGLLRHYARYLGLLDVPCARSSHTRTTPRGGGIGFVAAMLIWAWLQPKSDFLPAFWFAALPGAVGVALIGLWDDYRSLSAKSRLLVHCLAMGWSLWCLSPFFPTTWMYVPIPLVLPFWWLGGVWCTNLFNFMTSGAPR